MYLLIYFFANEIELLLKHKRRLSMDSNNKDNGSERHYIAGLVPIGLPKNNSSIAGIIVFGYIIVQLAWLGISWIWDKVSPFFMWMWGIITWVASPFVFAFNWLSDTIGLAPDFNVDEGFLTLVWAVFYYFFISMMLLWAILLPCIFVLACLRSRKKK